MNERPLKLRVVRFPLGDLTLEQYRGPWLEMRRADVTASVTGALFGMHPYETVGGLWAAKTGVEMPEQKDSPVKLRGRMFEEVGAKAFLEQHPGWKVRAAKVYLRAPEIRLGATPDFFITDPEGRRGVLQVKTCARFEFNKHWTAETAPTWIALQTLTEAMLAKAEFGKIAALIVDPYRPELHVYDVPRHAGAERRIQDTVVKFWTDITAGIEPKIDYERDAALIAVMWPREVPEKVIDLRADNELPELLDEQAKLDEINKQNSKRIDEIKNELKVKMGDAEAAMIGGGWRATFKEQHRKEHFVKATSFRVLRTTKEETKEAA